MNARTIAFLAGIALASTVLLTMGALVDELGVGESDGITISCGTDAADCNVQIRQQADWNDAETARALGVEPVRWFATVRVPAAKLTAVVDEIITGAGCTVLDAKPPETKSAIVLPAPCVDAEVK